MTRSARARGPFARAVDASAVRDALRCTNFSAPVTVRRNVRSSLHVDVPRKYVHVAFRRRRPVYCFAIRRRAIRCVMFVVGALDDTEATFRRSPIGDARRRRRAGALDAPSSIRNFRAASCARRYRDAESIRLGFEKRICYSALRERLTTIRRALSSHLNNRKQFDHAG